LRSTEIIRGHKGTPEAQRAVTLQKFLLVSRQHLPRVLCAWFEPCVIWIGNSVF